MVSTLLPVQQWEERCSHWQWTAGPTAPSLNLEAEVKAEQDLK